MNILCLEANPSLGGRIARRLESGAPHMHLEIVSTVKEALSKLSRKRTHVDLLLLDLSAADGDALSLVARVRARALPCAIVVLTEKNDEETAVGALIAGADDYIVKRRNFLAGLPETLESAYQRHRAAAEKSKRTPRLLYAGHILTATNLANLSPDHHGAHLELDVIDSARELLQRANDADMFRRYDMLLLDAHLPDQNALEAIKSLRETPWADLPIIVLADPVDEHIALQALRLGAFDYLLNTPQCLDRLPLLVASTLQRAWLHESEAHYRSLVDQIPLIIYRELPDETATTLYVSSQVSNTLGYSAEEWKADPELWTKGIHPEDCARVMAEFERRTKSGAPFALEYRFIRRDGSVIWLWDEAVLVRDERGQPLYWQGFMMDITEQKRAEAALRASQSQLEAIVNSAMDAIIMVDSDQRIVIFNPSAERMFGYTAAQMIGRPLGDLLPARFREIHQKHIKDFGRTGVARRMAGVTNRLLGLRANGEEFPVEISISRFEISGGRYYTAILRDVSQRMRQQMLQEVLYQIANSVISAPSLNDLFIAIHRALAGLMPAKNFYIALYDAETNLLSFPYFVDEQDETPASAPPGRGLTEYILRTRSPLLASPDVFEKLRQAGEVDLVGSPSLDWLGVPLTIDGQTIGVMVVQSYEEGTRYGQAELDIMRFVSSQVALAIQRKRAEETLAASEERYRQLVDLSPDAIAMHCEGKVVFINPAGAALMGAHDVQEILGKPVMDFVHPDYRQIALERIRAGIEKRVPQPLIEEKFIRLDGTPIDVEVASIPRTYQGKPAMQVIFRDISARKQAEEALRRREAILEAVGYAAGQFLQTQNWEQSIGMVLARLGQAAEVSRVYIFENHLAQDGALLTSQRHEWCAEGATPQIGNLELQNFPFIEGGFGRWVEQLSQDMILHGHVRDFPPSEREVLAAQDILSIAIVPIFVGEQWWGFIGYDECRAERDWQPAEVEALRTAARALGAAIQRRQAEETLRRQLKELGILHSAAIAGAQAASVDELIDLVTQVIGDALYPDNFGVLLLNETGAGLRAHPSYRGIAREDIPATIPLSQGIVGKVATNGQPQRIPDVRLEPAYLEVNPTTRAELCVPIKVGDRLLGVINAESSEPDFFTEADERLLSTTAGQLATAIEKLRLFQETQARVQELGMLFDIGQSMASAPLQSEEIGRLIAQYFIQFLGIPACSISLVNGDGTLRTLIDFCLKDGVLHANIEWIGKTYRLEDFHATARVMETLQPLIIHASDPNADPAELAHMQQTGSKSVAILPLAVAGKAIGIIELESPDREYEFTAEQIRLGTILANQTATALENARLFEVEQRRRQEAETLREAAAAASSSLKLEAVLGAILAALHRTVPYDSASVFLLEGDELRLVACQGFPEPETIVGLRFPADDRLFRAVQTGGRALILSDAQADARFQNWGKTNYVHGWMGVPLFVRDRVIGFITLDSRQVSAYDEHTARLAQAFANQAAIAIENARLYQNAVRSAERRAILHRVSQDVAAAVRDPEQTYRAIHDATRQMMSCDAFVISLLDEERDEIEALYLFERDRRYPVHRIAAGQGLSGQVIQSGETIILDDLAAIEGRSNVLHFGEPQSVQSLLAVPMRSGEKVIGMISAQSYQPHAYGKEEQALLEMLAAHAAVALENARLFEAEQRRRNEAETLRQAVSVVASTLERDQAIQLILDQLAEVVPYDSASVQILRDGYLEIVGGRGWPDVQAIVGIRFPIPGDNPNTVVIRERRAHILGNAPEAYAPFRQEPHSHIQSWLGVPLVVRDQVIGMLALDSMQKDHFNEESARLAAAFADQVAVTLENARLFTETQQRARVFGELYSISRGLAVAQDLTALLRTVVESATRMMDTNYGGLYLYDPASQELILTVAHNFTPPDPLPRLKLGEGMAGRVAQTRQPMVVRDYSTWEGRSPQYAGIPFTSILQVPMLFAGELIGVLAVDEMAPTIRTFSDDDVQLLSLFAAQAAGAVHSARLFEQTQRRLRELEAVNKVSASLRAAQTYEEMLPLLLDETLSVLGTKVGAIWLYDRVRNEVVQVEARGWLTDIPTTHLKPDQGIIGHVFVSGETHISPDILDDPKTYPDSRKYIPRGWASACVPIRTAHETIGVFLAAIQAPRQYAPEEINILTTLAEMAGNAIHRARLNEQTETQVRQLTALRDVDTAIASSFDLRVTLNILLDQATTQLEADAAAIQIYHPDLQILTCFNGRGFRTPGILRRQLRIGECLAGRVALECTPLEIAALGITDVARQELISDEQFVSYIGMPLTSKGQIKGVLEVFHRNPFTPDPDWLDFLQTLAGQGAIAIDNAQLFENLQRSNQELSLAYDTTLEGWGRALEMRDQETEGHTRRVTELTLRLAQRMGIGGENLTHIRRGVLLHDIGKMAIPDEILHKTDILSREEMELMQRHPQYAHDLLSPITYLHPALDIPYCHHERWDGTGYPRGLRGSEIPLAARIFAVVDVWDALLNDRPYREAWPREKALEYIEENSNKQFDPDVVEEFLKMITDSS